LDYLRKTRSASVREIARALKMSAPNVRHHLSVLCSDGRAEVNEIRSRAGRGRPEKIYTLARSAMGDNLAALTNALLETAGKGLNLEAVAERILGADQFANLSVPKRLALLIARLNEMHYQAHWEAGAGGPRVIFGRCPYWKVIEAHPEICKMDAALVQKAMARPVSQLRKNESARGLCPFIFQIGE
jgi:predicted ArsR family transcriptional regulator